MDGAGAAPAPFAPMPSAGSSASWNAQKNNVLRIVGLMLVAINSSANHPSKGLYPDSFRTAESAYISWDCTFYDPTFACAYIAIYQSKVDDEKLIPLVAGECMWLCW